jgi:UDPglucose--hexose-1-phosphate uridylyltransferase
VSELRVDPITGRWVIFTPDHTRRSTDFTPPSPLRSDPASCPFCEGHEELTGNELLAWRPGGSERNRPGWHLRVVPNREPVLRVESHLGSDGALLFQRFGGLGAHEVIIESARHEDSWTTMTVEAVSRVLWAWRERMRDLKRDVRLKSFVVLKNHGALAGARLDHPHSQLLAMPFVPPQLAEELEGAERQFKAKAHCVFCEIVQQELQLNQRVIASDDRMLTLAPFASRLPFESWVVPREHAARFEDGPDELLEAAAKCIQDLLRRLDATLLQPPFNVALHSAPASPDVDALFHWHIEILPRLTRVSGLGWGSGVFVNPVPPEEAAQVLRDAL